MASNSLNRDKRWIASPAISPSISKTKKTPEETISRNVVKTLVATEIKAYMNQRHHDHAFKDNLKKFWAVLSALLLMVNLATTIWLGVNQAGQTNYAHTAAKAAQDSNTIANQSMVIANQSEALAIQSEVTANNSLVVAAKGLNVSDIALNNSIQGQMLAYLEYCNTYPNISTHFRDKNGEIFNCSQLVENTTIQIPTGLTSDGVNLKAIGMYNVNIGFILILMAFLG